MYTRTHTHTHVHAHTHMFTPAYSLFVFVVLFFSHTLPAEEEMPTKQMLLQRTEDILKVVRTTNLNW